MIDLTKQKTEQLESLRDSISLELSRRKVPNLYKLFLRVDKFLEEGGYKEVPKRDYRYKQSGEYAVFNCPHLCGTITILIKTKKEFPYDLRVLSNISCGVGKDVTEEGAEELFTKFKTTLLEIIKKTFITKKPPT